MSLDVSALHPRTRARARRALAEVERLRRWAEFANRYRAEAADVPHGERTRLRLDLGAEMGMDDRETRRALYGS